MDSIDHQVHIASRIIRVAWVVAALVLGACSGSASPSLDPEAAEPIPVTTEELKACEVDDAEQDRLSSLPASAFDQDPNGGWRPVANRPGCELAAATLIADYIVENGIEPQDGVMHWHVGQLLALSGESQAAIPWMQTTVSASDRTWTPYVQGTIAFLTQDRTALQDAIESLAAIEVSEAEKATRRQYLEDNPDFDAPDGFVEEPQNLGILRGFASCFEEPYSEAYGCRP